MKRATRTETEKAILLQPEFLAKDWRRRVPPSALRTVARARHLVLAGTGSSYHCALWAQWLLHEYAAPLSSEVLHTTDLLKLCAVARGSARRFVFPPGTAVLLISHRGGKGLTRTALRAVGRTPHVLIAAEGAPTGPAPIVRSSPRERSNAHTIGVTAAMAAISELIAGTLAARAAAALRKARLETAGLAAALLLETTGSLSRRHRLNFSGDGPFYPIALELALKAREMARIPAIGFQAEELLHGPMAAFDSQDLLLPLPPLSGALPPEAVAALHNCRRTGSLFLIPRLSEDLRKQASRLPLSWQAVLLLIWGQKLCLAAALRRKINPDRNPFLR